MPGWDINDRTVMIAGAGTAPGAGLARCFAGLGARVVAMDRDECAILDMAGAAPGQIETLQIDVLRADHRVHLRKVWSGEPLALLVHLQILRHETRPAMALQSIASLTHALCRALKAGQGQSVYLFPQDPDDAIGRSLGRAYHGLASALQYEMRAHDVGVNGVMLPQGGPEAVDTDTLVRSLAMSVAPGAARFGGAILPLMPRSD